MNTIILNDVSFPLNYYNRNTQFDTEVLTSNGYINLGTGCDMQALFAIAHTPITSLKIQHDDTIIYELNNINAKVVSLDENFNSDAVNINLNLQFT